MEQKLYETLLNEHLSKEFIDEFEKLCKKHKTNIDSVIDKIYTIIEHIYDIEDIEYMLDLRYGIDFINNPNNKKIIEKIANRYRSHYDSEYSTWDNIDNAIDWVMES